MLITPDREQLKRAAIMSLVALGLMGALFLKIPLCPFALLTHHPCPGCGLTRATKALLSGDLKSSLHHHPLAMIVSPIVAISLLRSGLGYIVRGRWGEGERSHSRIEHVFITILLIAVFAVWIARFFGAFGGPELVYIRS